MIMMIGVEEPLLSNLLQNFKLFFIINEQMCFVHYAFLIEFYQKS